MIRNVYRLTYIRIFLLMIFIKGALKHVYNMPLLIELFTWYCFLRKRYFLATFKIKWGCDSVYAYIVKISSKTGEINDVLSLTFDRGCKMWQDPRNLIVYRYGNRTIESITQS